MGYHNHGENILKGVSPYIRAKFRMLLNKGNISREYSERIFFSQYIINVISKILQQRRSNA